MKRAKRLLVLVIDDRAETREVMRQMLEALGARVILARNGQHALETLASARPDLILCDLVMPGMDGFEFVRRLRADPRRRHLRVVALTGLGEDHDYLRTLEAGFDGHLIKPADYTVLARFLEPFLARAREPRRRPRRIA
jgi:hypothetical protein